MFETLIIIATYIYLVPVGLGLSKYPLLTKRQRLFFYFMVISAVCSLAAHYTASLGNNVFMVYIFAFCEAIVLPMFLFDNLDKQKLKFQWVSITLILVAAVILEATLRDGGLSKWNNLSLTLNALTMSILSIRLLLKLRFDKNINNLAECPEFWFSVGLGIYYLGNILIFAFARFFQTEDLSILRNLADFRLGVLILSASLYIKGFLIIHQTSKKSPPTV